MDRSIVQDRRSHGRHPQNELVLTVSHHQFDEAIVMVAVLLLTETHFVATPPCADELDHVAGVAGSRCTCIGSSIQGIRLPVLGFDSGADMICGRFGLPRCSATTVPGVTPSSTSLLMSLTPRSAPGPAQHPHRFCSRIPLGRSTCPRFRRFSPKPAGRQPIEHGRPVRSVVFGSVVPAPISTRQRQLSWPSHSFQHCHACLTFTWLLGP